MMNEEQMTMVLEEVQLIQTEIAAIRAAQTTTSPDNGEEE